MKSIPESLSGKGFQKEVLMRTGLIVSIMSLPTALIILTLILQVANFANIQ